jgi:phage terminase small subunit
MSDKPLTAKQQALAVNIASGMTQLEAYRRAYGNKSNDNTARSDAGKIARKPHVAAYIERLKADAAAVLAKNLADDLALDRQYVLRNLKTVVERCMQAEPVLDRKGNPTGEYVFDSKGANQALGMIGKELGMFVERREVRHGPLANATDEELDAELASVAKELSTMTGKPLRALLMDAARNELAIDITPTERAPLALADATGDHAPPGGCSNARAGAPE